MLHKGTDTGGFLGAAGNLNAGQTLNNMKNSFGGNAVWSSAMGYLARGDQADSTSNLQVDDWYASVNAGTVDPNGIAEGYANVSQGYQDLIVGTAEGIVAAGAASGAIAAFSSGDVPDAIKLGAAAVVAGTGAWNNISSTDSAAAAGAIANWFGDVFNSLGNILTSFGDDGRLPTGESTPRAHPSAGPSESLSKSLSSVPQILKEELARGNATLATAGWHR